ncbi:MAG: hypothetical protein WCH83_13330, partial [Alphaproteobacteria bacterium]
ALSDDPASTLASKLATWAGFAVLLVGCALFAARTESGQQRIASLFQQPSQTQLARGEPQRREISEPLLLYETRRLADAVRVLSAERDQLADRLASVERNVGDVTASITRVPVRAIEPNRIPTPQPVAQADPVVLAAPPNAAALDSVAIRTEFGVDLGGDTSVESLRARWMQLRAQHGQLLEGLRPVVAVQETRPGTTELRLVAGPLSNANAATRLCVTLGATGLACKTAVFDGQRLALR